jgi:2-C-methyl-D-erythritol 4-phosphate cytidylyltransferase
MCPGCIGIEGGRTRQETVALLVAATRKPCCLQDAARPFATLT